MAGGGALGTDCDQNAGERRRADPVLIVAGLTLKNLQPRVWDPDSPYYLPDLRGVMVSYAEFHSMPARRDAARRQGLRRYLDLPDAVQVYLDNGAFAFATRGGAAPREAYETFVRDAQPDWYAIPQDYIPTPGMSEAEQRDCLQRTMEVNRAYRQDGYVPVIHASPLLDEYLAQLQADQALRQKPVVGLGGLVPNLLRSPKAVPYDAILGSVRRARAALHGKRLHVFGIGGTATLHLAALLGIDSLDSSGWRNRAARGIVQLPGRGDRVVANMGSWRGRAPSADEWEILAACGCPACRQSGLDGLRAEKLAGFCHRATHNLWTLLREAEQMARRLADGTYRAWYQTHLDNSIYLPLIQNTVATLDPTHAVRHG